MEKPSEYCRFGAGMEDGVGLPFLSCSENSLVPHGVVMTESRRTLGSPHARHEGGRVINELISSDHSKSSRINLGS